MVHLLQITGIKGMSLQREIIDYQFRVKLDHWVALPGTADGDFSKDEAEHLERSRRLLRTGKRTVVILAFENTLAALGGLAAVLRYLPQALTAHGERVVVMTPLHTGVGEVREALKNGTLVRAASDIRINMCRFQAVADCYSEKDAPVPTYHVGINGRFCAGENPYGYADSRFLLIDAFAFCAAVPAILAELGMADRLLLHAHDWETAPIALFSRYAVLSGLLHSTATVLTLHNSFDSPLTSDVKSVFFRKPPAGGTVLQTMLPLLNGPLTTVSTPFAHELINDPLQCGVFADHLQEQFRMNPPLGIENGMFGTSHTPFSTGEITSAHKEDYTPVLKKKAQWRKELSSIIKKMKDARTIGHLDLESARSSVSPVLFMSGRYDLMQKGFDVIFNAMRLIPRGTVKLLFSPTLHNENDDISFFSEIAHECDGDIGIWPYRIDVETYQVCLKGSNFLVMPSLYEPFGSASEGLLHGTPLLARATGGLLSQLVPEDVDAIPPMHRMFFPRPKGLVPNSILFREKIGDVIAKASWRNVLESSLQERVVIPLYSAMVEAAGDALKRAAAIFASPQQYGAMVAQALESVQTSTWESAARKYSAVFDAAQFRG